MAEGLLDVFDIISGSVCGNERKWPEVVLEAIDFVMCGNAEAPIGKMAPLRRSRYLEPRPHNLEERLKMTIKNDIEELQKAMAELDAAERRQGLAMDKITRRMTHAQAVELLGAFGISLHYEGGVRTVRSKPFMDFVREDMARQACERGEI
jgi:hypothetical protein